MAAMSPSKVSLISNIYSLHSFYSPSIIELRNKNASIISELPACLPWIWRKTPHIYVCVYIYINTYIRSWYLQNFCEYAFSCQYLCWRLIVKIFFTSLVILWDLNTLKYWNTYNKSFQMSRHNIMWFFQHIVNYLLFC